MYTNNQKSQNKKEQGLISATKSKETKKYLEMTYSTSQLLQVQCHTV